MQLDAFSKLLDFSDTSSKLDFGESKSGPTAPEIGEKANSILVTSAWQTLLESPDLAKRIYPKALHGKSENLTLGVHLEKYIVCLGDDKYFLLVFDPALKSDEPVRIDASQSNSSGSISAGYSIWQTKMRTRKRNPFDFLGWENRINPFDRNNQSILGMVKPEVIQRGVEKNDWPIVVAKPPKRIYTSVSYSQNAHHVRVVPNTMPTSLAGIYTTNTSGQFGATTCLHAFPNSYVETGKTKAMINGIEGVVVTAHNISDSCFVNLNADKNQLKDLKSLAGVIEKSTPRQFESCSYINKNGVRITTNILGWSPDILYYDYYNQVKVLTKATTNPGDSGSALLDSSDRLVGFSFFRTELEAPMEFSAWIWAASVFKAHNLLH